MSMVVLLLLCLIVWSLRNVIKCIWTIFLFCFIIALFGKTFLFISLLIGLSLGYILYQK